MSETPPNAPLVATPTERHGNLRMWAPGQSGNPGGRSKAEAHLARLVRDNSPHLFDQLMEISTNKRAPATARVMAINALLDRGFGKAPQRVMVETDLASMTDGQLDSYIRAQLLEHVKTIEGQADAE